MRTTQLLLATTLLAGCPSDFSVRPDDKDPASVDPVIAVVPEALAFGEQTSLDLVTEIVTIHNYGFGTLDVSDIELIGAQSYSITLPQPLPWAILPQESATFEVTLEPVEGGDIEGQVLITSDDPGRPEVPVALSAFGALPNLKISPDPMAFGDRFIPCDDSRFFSLENTGPEPLVIQDIRVEGQTDLIGMGVEPPLPITLAQGQIYQLPMVFEPEFELNWTAELAVDSNDLRGTQTAPITGNAKYAAVLAEDFVIPESYPVNILFAVDQSCSMDAHSANLASSFQSFVNVLDGANADWKIGVTTVNPCFRRNAGSWGFIQSSSGSWQTDFAQAVAWGEDSSGNSTLTEKLMELTKQAIAADQPGGCNYGFRDPGAPLHIIMVSDEEDQSPGAPFSWSSYLNGFSAYAGSNADWKVHAIVDRYPNPNRQPPCGGVSGPGQYLNAANATNGFVLDVCTSTWPSQFASVAQAAVADLGVWPLGESGQVSVNPDTIAGDSVRVFVDNVEWTTGWHWDDARKAVVFDTDPPANAALRITYGIAPSCP